MIDVSPTKGTRIVAHLAVGTGVAILVARTFGKGADAAVASGLLAMLAHELLDAPAAQVMAASGLQF